MVNNYSGFRPSADWKPDIITAIDSKEFFLKYITTRTPCILQNTFNFDWLNLEYLNSKETTVQVETLKDSTFGHEGRTEIHFKEFVEKLKDGNIYLTTQYTEENSFDEFSIKSFAAPPLDQFIKEIPTRLEIFKNLVPQQMNLWIGSSKEGTSSGLHHDVNFY
jgi:hypothetical protein